jgi:hypothetical protein
MKFTRIRWLRALVAATFLWSNVTVAAHACITALAAQVHEAVALQDAVPEHEGCAHEQPSPADPALCLTHCLQADEITAQKIIIGVPGAVCPPVLFLLSSSAHALPVAPVLALAVPIVGPPLTILFRNFRI